MVSQKYVGCLRVGFFRPSACIVTASATPPTFTSSGDTFWGTSFGISSGEGGLCVSGGTEDQLKSLPPPSRSSSPVSSTKLRVGEFSVDSVAEREFVVEFMSALGERADLVRVVSEFHDKMKVRSNVEDERRLWVHGGSVLATRHAAPS